MNILKVGRAHGRVLSELHHDGFDAPWTAQAFADALSVPGTLAFLSEDAHHQPLGFVLVRSGGTEAEVLTLATRPHARRQGVAKALMLEAQETLKSASIDKLFLEVATDNQKARALYLDLGFKEVGRRKDYYKREKGQRMDALVMALNLFHDHQVG